MTAQLSSNLLALGTRQDSLQGPTRWTLAASLSVHVFLLFVAMTMRFPHHVERPAASYQVSLVTLRPLPTTPVAAAPPQVPVQRAAVTSSVPPPVKSAPRAMPEPPQPPRPAVLERVPPVPSRSAAAGQNLMKDVLRGIELPPEAPRLSETQPSSPVTPAPTSRTRRDIEQMMSRLVVPDVAKTPVAPVPEPRPVPMTQQSIVEELEKLTRQLQAVQPEPVPAPPSVASVPTAPAPSRATSMRVEGVAAGASSYFSRIQGLVSRHWAPPKVDLGGREPKVVVRFRLHRSGAVSDVVIESSSGNDYYDAAGKRAVLAAAGAQLPPFPAGLASPYVDVTFSFGVEANAS